MRILTPINAFDQIDALLSAGADEFYAGFFDPVWNQRFGPYADINRMSGYGSAANRFCFDDVLRLADTLSQRNATLYVTFNANGYDQWQIEFLCKNYFPSLANADVAGVIVSDDIIANAARSCGLEPVASTMCGIYNIDIAAVYEKIGVSRMILPRDLSLMEIEKITAAFPNVEFEVFYMRNGCVFSDSHCLGVHRSEFGGICSTLKYGKRRFLQSGKDFREMHDLQLTDLLYSEFFHRTACGMCALYRLTKMNVSSLKIVGRADSSQKIFDDVTLTKMNLKIAEQVSTEKEYLENMVLPIHHERNCLLGFSCYYPEVRFFQNDNSTY